MQGGGARHTLEEICEVATKAVHFDLACDKTGVDLICSMQCRNLALRVAAGEIADAGGPEDPVGDIAGLGSYVAIRDACNAACPRVYEEVCTSKSPFQDVNTLMCKTMFHDNNCNPPCFAWQDCLGGACVDCGGKDEGGPSSTAACLAGLPCKPWFEHNGANCNPCGGDNIHRSSTPACRAGDPCKPWFEHNQDKCDPCGGPDEPLCKAGPPCCVPAGSDPYSPLVCPQDTKNHPKPCCPGLTTQKMPSGKFTCQ